jgi:predicted acyltransferase
MVETPERQRHSGDRLMSLDFFRGITMLLLIAEATGIYEILAASPWNGTLIGAIGQQFQHHPWHGLRLWDLGQPFFMFISGVAMAFSYGQKWEKGSAWKATFSHALRRSFLLFVFGWALYQIYPAAGASRGAFLYDILPQLSVACLIAFLMMRRPPAAQFTFSLGLLALTELLYRLWRAPGFDQAFAPGRNFGSCIDQLLMGKLSVEHWVAFSAVPMTALVLWGVLAGELLKSKTSPARKVITLLAAGLIGVAAGFTLNPLTPIIRRIATSSFVIAAGGFCLLALAAAYGLIDIMRFRKPALFFVVVGMNPLFLYLFTQSGGAGWLERIVRPFTMGLLGGIGRWPAQAGTSLAVLALLWAGCYWLYKRNIFFRI